MENATHWRTKMADKLTDEDKNMIVYFIKEKGDLKRWGDYEEKKDQIKEEFPSLIKAIEDIEHAENVLDLVVRTVEDSVEDCF